MKPARRSLLAAMLGAACATWALPAAAQLFSTPVGCDDCISFWYYLDHGNRTDYNCESSTYDNHNGSDYSLRGGNARIDDGNEVVAARAGIVRTVSDGNYDRCEECGGTGCGTNTPGSGFSNYVVIDHGDYDTTYGHMRSGSITVQEGDMVECGALIGHIGSAGCSTGAHLHFQPRPPGGSYRNNPLDPYQGPCSPTEPSLWAEQGPHRGLPDHTCDDQLTAPQPAVPPALPAARPALPQPPRLLGARRPPRWQVPAGKSRRRTPRLQRAAGQQRLGLPAAPLCRRDRAAGVASSLPASMQADGLRS